MTLFGLAVVVVLGARVVVVEPFVFVPGVFVFPVLPGLPPVDGCPDPPAGATFVKRFRDAVSICLAPLDMVRGEVFVQLSPDFTLSSQPVTEPFLLMQRP
jgi:hypothetical protein